MKKYIVIFLLLLVMLPVGFMMVALEPESRVMTKGPVTAADAKRAREIFREFRALTEAAPSNRTLKVNQRDLNSALKFAMRAVPRIQGAARVLPRSINVIVSLELPFVGWLNVTAEVGASEDGLKVTSFRFGRFGLPPGMVLETVRNVLDIVLGDGLGSVAANSIGFVRIQGDVVAVGVAMDRDERKALARSAKSKIRRVAGIVSEEHVRRYWLALDRAARTGSQAQFGSFAGYLKQAIILAADHVSGPDPEKEMQAAILALAIYCGHIKFQNIVGDVVPEQRKRTPTRCASATLAGRHDLRQHFSISAGLKTASDAGIAFAIGEFKELLDSNKGGSGFSFDDIAADRAGIEFARKITTVDPKQWRLIAATIRSEDAFFPRVAGLPSNMPEAEFRSKFGAVDSKKYKAMLDEIDRRIARSRLFAAF